MPANKIKIEPALLRRYKKQTQKRKPRQVVCRILIVCEGEKTEPNYFKAFKKYNQGTFVYDLDIKGEGMNTVQVVDRAIELRDKAKGTETEYDRVWAVFDKDSFPPNKFNNAIIKARDNGIECAWSNQAFELWFLYHFQYRISAMSRNEYKEKISAEVNKSLQYSQKNKYIYVKNDPENYSIMTTCGSQELALKWAETKCQEYKDLCFHKHNPCTMVFRLVRQLIRQDEDLNKELSTVKLGHS